MKRETISSTTCSIAPEEAHTAVILGCRRRSLHMCSLWILYTTRKTVIVCALLAAVPLEPLLDHILTAVQDLESLLISGQLIRCGSNFEPLLIIPSSAVV
jgi:hypothetical protein